MRTQKAVAVARNPSAYTEEYRGQAWSELRRKALNVPEWRAKDLKQLATGIVEYEQCTQGTAGQ